MIVYVQKHVGSSAFKFEAGIKGMPGSPYVGRGPTIKTALGSLMLFYAKEMGISHFDLDDESLKTWKASTRRQITNKKTGR